MSDVNQRRRRRMKHQRIQRQVNRMLEHLQSVTYAISGIPDIRPDIDEILAPLQPHTRRPLRLTRRRP